MNLPPEGLDKCEILAQDVDEGDCLWLEDYKFAHNQQPFLPFVSVTQRVVNPPEGTIILDCQDMNNVHVTLTCNPNDILIFLTK